jgi:SAM-dependent methyltransferase
MPIEQFYDELVPYYDLIFPDWDASMARQGDALALVIRDTLGRSAPASPRLLDVASGIGTQSLPLAARGFLVTARDLSPQAIARLAREAAERGLTLDTGVADMRTIAATVKGTFDAVLCGGNSLPHLLTDRDIVTALSEFRAVLDDKGIFVCSVRDYDRIDRATEGHDYGERRRGDQLYRLRQEWHWTTDSHYDVTFVVEEQADSGPIERIRTVTQYYAIGIPRLLELMAAAGFAGCGRIDDVFYQPLLVGRPG